jgi:hypothetical protein
MIRKIGAVIGVALVVYWVASGDARRALDRENLLTHHRNDCVYADTDWMLGEHKTCSLVLTTGNLLCVNKAMYMRSGPTDFQPEGDCRKLDVAYHGNMETSVPSLPMNWDCQLKNDASNGTNYLECRVPK